MRDRKPTTNHESTRDTSESQDATEIDNISTNVSGLIHDTDGDIETKIEGIPLVPEPTREVLDAREQVDYAQHRRSWLDWSLNVGKKPEYGEGYSVATMKSRASHIDRFFRWLWSERDGGYTTVVTTDDADAYVKEMAFSEYGQEHKANTVKALSTYFSWMENERNGDNWEPNYTFSSPNRQSSTRDALTREERRLIREAALRYGSVPHYNSVSPAERDRWNIYLAQRFEKPKSEVTKADWERANGWKIPSLVWTSLDTALRPIEVQRSTVEWVDLDKRRLVIPAAEAAKSKGATDRRQWTPVLMDRTVEALRRWLKQRACYDRYEGRDELWLTERGNPYESNTLSYLMDRLCDLAGIDITNRQVSWYSIRRGTVTELVDAADLSTAAEQVRHRDIRSTRRYDQAPEHRRRDALDSIE